MLSLDNAQKTNNMLNCGGCVPLHSFVPAKNIHSIHILYPYQLWKLLMPPPEFIEHICNMVEAFQVAQQFKAFEIINCTAFYLYILFNEHVFI